MSARPAPRVCICVPAYNSAATLPATLDSILGQTYRNLAVVVADNASTDDTAAIAERYAARDPRLKLLRYSENVGGEGNFSRCLGLAEGDYTAIYHSDDIYSPGMVAEQVEFLEKHPDAGAVFTMARAIDSAGVPGRLYRLPPELRRAPGHVYSFEEIFRGLLKRGNVFLFCPSAMARSELYRDRIRKWDAGGFNTSADLDVWLRLLLLGGVGIIDKPLLNYRGAAATSFSYVAARTKTVRHDIFKVLEHYMSGPAAAIMGPREKDDYALLVLKDDINRAFVYLVTGERSEARSLLSGLFSLRLNARAAGCAEHSRNLMYGWGVWLLTFFPLSRGLRESLAKARYGG